jgi:drug/metabolite transporter (DMT)-like permease
VSALTPRAAGLIVLLAFLWGGAYPLLKVAVETIPPLTVAAFRAAVGGLMVLMLLGPRGALELWLLLRSGRMLWIQSFFNCIVPWVLIAWAAIELDASLMTILNSLSPVFIFLLTWAVTKHEPATGRKFLGVMLGISGVATIIGVDALSGLGRKTVAELACLGGSFAYAIAAITGTRYRTSPLVPAAGSLLLACLVLVPLALYVDGVPTQASTRSILAVAALCIFSTGAAFVVYFRLLNTVGSIATSAQGYLRVFIGVGLGVIFLDEKLTPSMLAGLAMVVAGVVTMTTRPRG